MKTVPVILSGGSGTRLSEETKLRPNPMIEVGGRLILLYIMKIYERFGINNFVKTLRYRGAFIKDYFLNYHPCMSDLMEINRWEVYQ